LGHTEDLAWVVARFSPLLLAQARYRLGPVLRPHYDPEDLVQDTWLAAMPRIAALAAPHERYAPALVRFLTTILVNRVRKLAHRCLRGEPLERTVVHWGRDDSSSPLLRIADPSGGVLQRVMLDEAGEQLLARLDQLSKRDREIIILRGIEQLANETVAMLLHLTPQAVSMRYQRALERLKRLLPDSVFCEFI